MNRGKNIVLSRSFVLKKKPNWIFSLVNVELYKEGGVLCARLILCQSRLVFWFFSLDRLALLKNRPWKCIVIFMLACKC